MFKHFSNKCLNISNMKVKVAEEVKKMIERVKKGLQMEVSVYLVNIIVVQQLHLNQDQESRLTSSTNASTTSENLSSNSSVYKRKWRRKSCHFFWRRETLFHFLLLSVSISLALRV